MIAFITVVPLLLLIWMDADAMAESASTPVPARMIQGPQAVDSEKRDGVSETTGVVAAVDPAGGTMALRAADKVMLMSAETITARKALTTVSAGDSVRVAYVTKQGRLLIQSLVPQRET